MKVKWMLTTIVVWLASTAIVTPSQACHFDRHLCSYIKEDPSMSKGTLQQVEKYIAYAKGINHRKAANEVTISSADAASSQKRSLSYVVQRGDTLYQLAKTFNTTVDLLMLDNKIVDPTRLQIGQQLKINSDVVDTETWLNQNQMEKVISATLTAYTAGVESTGKRPGDPAYGITSSGTKVKEGRTIAVDPKVIPIGSTVYIEGVGLRTAEDTGSAIKGSRIDVFIEDLQEALEFGVKKDMKVFVLSVPDHNT